MADNIANTETAKTVIGVGDPTALGLISYGIALISLSFIVGHIYPPSDMIMSIIIIGTVGIGLAGILDFLRGQTFGGVAFIGWGLFFWAFTYVVAAAPIPKGSPWAAGPQLPFLGWYFLFWATFGLLTFIGSVVARKWVMLRTALGFTTLMLVVVAVAHWIADPKPNYTLMLIGGICGIIAALCAGYTAFAALINEIAGRTIIPA